jgi:multiple sugar transport system permease protein
MTRQAQVVRAFSYVFLCVSSFIMIWPVLYAFLGAFTTGQRLSEAVLLPIPNTLNLRIFSRIFNQGGEQAYNTPVMRAYLFTLARCAFYVTRSVVVGMVGGYVFSKLRFPGRNKIFLLFLAGMVMPAIVMILPMFLMMARFPNTGGNNWFGQGGHGLIGDLKILFVFGWVPPLAIFLLKQAYDMVPTEYEDAAKIDGAGFFAILYRIYWPLLKPPVVALVVITFLMMWNDYLWPSLTISPNGDFVPITLLLSGAVASNFGGAEGGPSPFSLIGVLLALWPPALVYFLLQRFFVQGMVASGLKG